MGDRLGTCSLELNSERYDHRLAGELRRKSKLCVSGNRSEFSCARRFGLLQLSSAARSAVATACARIRPHKERIGRRKIVHRPVGRAVRMALSRGARNHDVSTRRPAIRRLVRSLSECRGQVRRATRPSTAARRASNRACSLLHVAGTSLLKSSKSGDVRCKPGNRGEALCLNVLVRRDERQSRPESA